MKIVIDLPKEYYEALKEMSGETLSIIDRAIIRYGTPLPEHHGDLIDVNVLKNNIHYVPLAPIFQGDYVTYRNVIFADILDMLPTIIEGSDSE